MVEKVNNAPNGRVINESTPQANNDAANDVGGNDAIELNFIRHKLTNFQTTIIKDVEKRIAIVVDEILQEIRQHELQAKEFQNFANVRRVVNSDTNTWNNRTAEDTTTKVKHQQNDKQATKDQNKQATHAHSKNLKRNSLPDKIFTTRESYLTALLRVDHMRTIYHIFHIIFVMLCMHTVVHDYFVEGSINFGLVTFREGFDKIHYVLGVWLLQHVFVFLLYYAFAAWSCVRARLAGQGALQRFWSHSCLITYIGSQLVFYYIATALCIKFDLPFVSGSVLLLESTRLVMKMHAFVRTNAARVLADKIKSDGDLNGTIQTTYKLAPFSWYLYFLFAPTLVYRESYPRTPTIRWKFVVARFVEGLAVAFLFSYLHERHSKVHFGDYGKVPITTAELIVKYFGMCMPSIIIFLGGFYLILHSWLNFTSELLRFGDRMFYKDWWTSGNYDTYYRNWNVVVHDWLYEYIYKDSYKYLFRGSKLAASLMVFTTSAVIHELILGYALQFFFPVMFFCFGIVGVTCVFLTRRWPKNLGNLFLWFSLISGNSFLISLYYMEHYARLNCTNVLNEHWSDVFIPVLWRCKY